MPTHTHHAISHLLRWFECEHLPAGRVRNASRQVGNLAHAMVANIDHHSPQLEVALTKLLEAKDAYVRAVITDSASSNYDPRRGE